MNTLLRTHCTALLTSAFLLACTTSPLHADPQASPAGAARYAMEQGHYAEASRAFEEAARTFPSSFTPEYLLSAAEAAVKAGNPPRAERLLKEIPDNSLEASQIERLRAVRVAIGLDPALPTGATAAAAVTPSGSVLPGVAGNGHIALLLPLSGTLGGSSAIVRDGFLAADAKAGNHSTVKVYDSGNTDESSLAAYRQALNEGAGFVAGPLRKESVAAIAALGQPPVPVLALNYLEEGQHAPFNYFQFGLAPEDEARAAAERAVADGGKRAIALVPRSEWGERVLAALDKRLRELGGAVIKSARYSPGDNDYGKTIQDLLNLESSESRHRALTGILGTKSEFTPRRRDDIDFIFFAARPSDGRMIWPQFRFYRATGLPVYATSLVYGGGTDNELNGVRFCDMPWMLQTDGAIAALRSEFSAALPGAQSQPRLFALGFDAYNIVTLLQSGQMQTGNVYPAATGGLRMTANGAIARSLNCAQFRDGSPRTMDVTPTTP